MTRAELARSIRERALLEGDFVLRSGLRSSYYLDKYRFETEPRLLQALGTELARRVGEVEPGATRLAGPELGAVPLVTATSLVTGLPFLIVRRNMKDYATARRIEGAFGRGETVCLVEDVVTTGGAALGAVESLRDAGMLCRNVVCVVDREEGGEEGLRAAGVALTALFRLDDVRMA